MDLHGRIMNIKVDDAKMEDGLDTIPNRTKSWNEWLRDAYKLGHRDARHAAAELVAGHEAEEQWQPIETAPKDKTILLWGRYWSDEQGWFQNPLMGEWNKIRSRWEAVWACWFGVRPTHWQPLPASPTSPKENKLGVHASHCCIIHGCKYHDEKCPVVMGEVEQGFNCEDCKADQCHKEYMAEADTTEGDAHYCKTCGLRYGDEPCRVVSGGVNRRLYCDDCHSDKKERDEIIAKEVELGVKWGTLTLAKLIEAHRGLLSQWRKLREESQTVFNTAYMEELEDGKAQALEYEYISIERLRKMTLNEICTLVNGSESDREDNP